MNEDVNAPQMLMWGNPVDGFKLAGPLTPNDPDVDRFIDTDLRDETWWYVPLTHIPRT